MAGTRDKRARAKGRRKSGPFLALPRVLTDSRDFRMLSGSALKALLMIATQFNGKNNGDLQATFALAREWGIASEATLAKAMRELRDAGMVLKTREGVFANPGRKCALYAVTWHRIDECEGKLDVAATVTAPRSFSAERNGKPATETVASGYRNCSHRPKEC